MAQYLFVPYTVPSIPAGVKTAVALPAELLAGDVILQVLATQPAGAMVPGNLVTAAFSQPEGNIQGVAANLPVFTGPYIVIDAVPFGNISSGSVLFIVQRG